MEWFNSQEWSFYVLTSIVMLLFALSLWSERKRARRTGVRYFTALVGLLIGALDVYILIIAPQLPLAVRVLKYLALILLVIMIVVTWPRKKT